MPPGGQQRNPDPGKMSRYARLGRRCNVLEATSAVSRRYPEIRRGRGRSFALLCMKPNMGPGGPPCINGLPSITGSPSRGPDQGGWPWRRGVSRDPQAEASVLFLRSSQSYFRITAQAPGRSILQSQFDARSVPGNRRDFRPLFPLQSPVGGRRRRHAR